MMAGRKYVNKSIYKESLVTEIESEMLDYADSCFQSCLE